jgi:hypothetical protein
MISGWKSKAIAPESFALWCAFLLVALVSCIFSGCGLTSHLSVRAGTATPQAERQLYLTGRYIGDTGSPFDGLCAFRLSDGVQQRCTGIPVTISTASAAKSGILFTPWGEQAIAEVRLATADLWPGFGW